MYYIHMNNITDLITFPKNNNVSTLIGDCMDHLKQLPDLSINCCVTSPPYYGLRDYGVDGQIGLEDTPDGYIARLVGVFGEVKRVLRDDGTLWINIGDSYAANRTYQVPSTKGGAKHGPGQAAGGKGSRVPDGMKSKDLIGIPWMLAFALRKDGWYLRQDIIWHKPNVMPESVKDRCTKAHEYIFMLTKSEKYHFDSESIKEDAARYQNADGTAREGGKRNRRSVWTIPTKPFKEAHFAVFPPALIEPCIKAGCIEGGTVLDPFGGSGTTGEVTSYLGRKAILIELNPEYAKIAAKRCNADLPPI